MSVEGVFVPSLRLFALVEVEQLAINATWFMLKTHDRAVLIFGFAGDEVLFLAGFAEIHAVALGCWRRYRPLAVNADEWLHGIPFQLVRK